MVVPQIKFEHSPADSLADSFASTPGSHYPSLFDESGMDQSEVLTPPFDDDDDMFDQSMSGTPGPEKKPVKKRKSWGQQLPEPKTNLPPRKRAKTEDEKEQRRVERVLRNRRAAQSSRERKRQEVEALEAEKMAIERRYQDLELRLQDSEAKNLILQQQIAQITGNMTVFNRPSSPQIKQETYQQTPDQVTFSQELFSSRDGHNTSSFPTPSVQAQMNTLQAPIRTVNPASLSPEIRPVAESSSNASSSDMTQHPAAMLCDLQCQSEEQRPWMTTPSTSSTLSVLTLCLMLISATTSTILSPLSAIINSLRTGSSLSPTASVLSTIIWLTTTPSSLTTTTTSTTSSTTTSSPNCNRPKFSLRLNLLRRLLACSPQLARPLMDATMGAMRSASEQQLLARDCLNGGSNGGSGVQEREASMECLMTLLWATRVIDREHRQQFDKALRQEDKHTTLEVRQACAELDELFRAKTMYERRVLLFTEREEKKQEAKKSRCLAFEHEGES